MNVVHLSCRLSEGGAARVATDIIRNASERFQHSFVYGYSRGGRPSTKESSVPRVLRIGGDLRAAGNLLSFRLLGADLLGPRIAIRDELRRLIASADVVHVHGIHSYYLPLTYFFDLVGEGKAPVIFTTHDFWWLTGRCAFTEGCDRWRHACYKCPELTNYPPAYLDNASRLFPVKRRAIQSLGDRAVFVSPANFLASLHREAFPTLQCVTIRNGASLEFLRAAHGANWQFIGEEALIQAAVVAADLRDATKTDPAVVRALAECADVKLNLIGAHGHAIGIEGACIHGEIRDRAQLAQLLLRMDVLVFSSKKDICPLVVLEAAVLGLVLVCISSPATDELMAELGYRTFSCSDDVCKFVKSRECYLLCRDMEARVRRAGAAQKLYGVERMVGQYEDLYDSVAKTM